MNLYRIILIIILFTKYSFTVEQYPATELEPASFAIKAPIPGTSPQQYAISIYIIFGKYKFRPFFHDGGSRILVCEFKRCIFAISICIRFIGTEDDFKFPLPNSTPPYEVNLRDIDTVTREDEIVARFSDMIKEGDVEQVMFTTSLGSLDTLSATVTDTNIYLQGVDSNDGSVRLRFLNLIDLVNGSYVQGDGSPVDGETQPGQEGRSFYEYPTVASDNKLELVNKFKCKFNRRLARVAFCSEKFYNNIMCFYYSRLLIIDPDCGKDIKISSYESSIHGYIVTIGWIVVNIMKRIIEILMNTN